MASDRYIDRDTTYTSSTDVSTVSSNQTFQTEGDVDHFKLEKDFPDLFEKKKGPQIEIPKESFESKEGAKKQANIHQTATKNAMELRQPPPPDDDYWKHEKRPYPAQPPHTIIDPHYRCRPIRKGVNHFPPGPRPLPIPPVSIEGTHKMIRHQRSNAQVNMNFRMDVSTATPDPSQQFYSRDGDYQALGPAGNSLRKPSARDLYQRFHDDTRQVSSPARIRVTQKPSYSGLQEEYHNNQGNVREARRDFNSEGASSLGGAINMQLLASKFRQNNDSQNQQQQLARQNIVASRPSASNLSQEYHHSQEQHQHILCPQPRKPNPHQEYHGHNTQKQHDSRPNVVSTQQSGSNLREKYQDGNPNLPGSSGRSLALAPREGQNKQQLLSGHQAFKPYVQTSNENGVVARRVRPHEISKAQAHIYNHMNQQRRQAAKERPLPRDQGNEAHRHGKRSFTEPSANQKEAVDRPKRSFSDESAKAYFDYQQAYNKLEGLEAELLDEDEWEDKSAEKDDQERNPKVQESNEVVEAGSPKLLDSPVDWNHAGLAPPPLRPNKVVRVGAGLGYNLPLPRYLEVIEEKSHWSPDSTISPTGTATSSGSLSLGNPVAMEQMLKDCGIYSSDSPGEVIADVIEITGDFSRNATEPLVQKVIHKATIPENQTLRGAFLADGISSNNRTPFGEDTEKWPLTTSAMGTSTDAGYFPPIAGMLGSGLRSDLQFSVGPSKSIPLIDLSEEGETVIPSALKGTDRNGIWDYPMTANRRIALGGRRADVVVEEEIDRRRLNIEGRLDESDLMTIAEFLEYDAKEAQRSRVEASDRYYVSGDEERLATKAIIDRMNLDHSTTIRPALAKNGQWISVTGDLTTEDGQPVVSINAPLAAAGPGLNMLNEITAKAEEGSQELKAFLEMSDMKLFLRTGRKAKFLFTFKELLTLIINFGKVLNSKRESQDVFAGIECHRIAAPYRNVSLILRVLCTNPKLTNF